MPNSSSTIAQITSGGRNLQAKSERICIGNVLDSPGKGSGGTASGGGGGGGVSGLYIHVPFCFHKCHYCDFYSIVDSQDRQAAFVERLIAELAASRPWLTRRLQTIFVGGGTPTLLRVELWQTLLAAMREMISLEPGYEWTVEANPETLAPELVEVLIAGGVNRFSIGCQSFNPVHLKTLERWHDPRNVHRSVQILRAAGVGNFNLDLIFGIPGQSLGEWQADLDEALSLEPAHISCYSLMYEPNTPLTQKLKAGQVQRIDEDLEASMYEFTIDRLPMAGYEHYEISNWARAPRSSVQRGDAEARRREESNSKEIRNPIGSLRSSVPPRLLQSNGENDCKAAVCRHNLLYWTNANWWAVGPAASGHFHGVRWKNVPRLQEYLDHGPLPTITDVEQLDADGRVGEQLMLGLRLMRGMACEQVENLLHIGSRGAQRRNAIERHIKAGLLQEVDSRLCLTRAGLLVADGVLADLI